ncbi:MAG: phasin family protein [Pseudomonadota bacterium]
MQRSNVPCQTLIEPIRLLFLKELIMVNIAEKVAAYNRANLETVLQAVNIALGGAERLMELQLAAAKAIVADGARTAKALTEVKDAKELVAVPGFAVEPQAEKAMAFARNVYEVTVKTQADFAKLLEERAAELNQETIATLEQVAKTAPAGAGADAVVAAMKQAVAASSSAYDTMSKAAKQVAEMTEANVTAITAKTTGAKRKAA